MLKSKQAEDNLKAATEELNAKKGVLTEKTEEYENQALKTIAAQEKEAAIAKLQKGDFEGVANSLLDLSKKELTYQDANGKTVKLSKEQTKDMADFIAQELSRIDTVQGKVWQKMRDSSGANLNEMVKKAKDITPKFKEAGAYYVEGIMLGLNSRKARLYAEAREMGLGAKYAFEKALKINSPSKEMMEDGAWFDEGIILGIASGEDKIAKMATQVAQTANTSFSDMLNPITDSYTGALADAGLKVKTSIGETIEANANPHITVKVGEDTLIDKVIDGINQASFLQNRGVINI